MNKLRHIRNRILYGSLSRSLYKEVVPLLTLENNTNMKSLALITVVFGGILSVLSFFGVLSRNVLPAYLFLLVTSVMYLIIRVILKPKGKYISYALCITQCACLLIFGMLNSTVFAPDPEQNGTIFAVLLLVAPFLMTDIPWRMDILLAISLVQYIILLRMFKAPGVVSLDTTNAVFVFLVSAFCNWIFSARNMQNLANRLYIEKERDSDALTGLLTKNSAKILTDTHLLNGERGIFAIIDLDNFKSINDTYGHLYGDKIIRKVADCIKANTRRTDVASRFGGDEFTVYFPEMSLEAASEKAEVILKALRASLGDEKIKVTCSIGIAQSDPLGDYNKMFDDADKALYESKSSGKDTYTISGSQQK